MTGTTFINAVNWPYMAGGQEFVVLPDAEAVLRANGWVHRTDLLRDQLAHTPAPVVANLEET